MPTRRQLMTRSAAVAAWLAGAGLMPASAQALYNRAAFDGKTVDEVVKGLGIARPLESTDVSLTAPDIAEDGAVVPVAASSKLAGVRRIAFLVEKNPTTLAGVFDFSDRVDTRIRTRIKMAETSNVLAVAILDDGRVLFARKEVKVTLGGCGG